jgi:hypothetical protein
MDDIDAVLIQNCLEIPQTGWYAAADTDMIMLMELSELYCEVKSATASTRQLTIIQISSTQQGGGFHIHASHLVTCSPTCRFLIFEMIQISKPSMSSSMRQLLPTPNVH